MEQPLPLSEYVVNRLRAGATKTMLMEELTALGWTDEEMEAAYRGGIVALGAPVPNEANRATLSRKSSTADIIVNFFSFIVLGVIASALGTLLFQEINLVFPDALDVTNWYSMDATMNEIHYATAALLIGFPLYYFSMRLWFRKFREDEGRMESKLSRWLTYLVLLVTAVTIVGDLIAVVYTLLQGEITMRFCLKALVIFVITGAIFGFYYLERRKIQYHIDIPRRWFRYSALGMTLFIACAIIAGFFVAGSPKTQRERTFDQTRSGHLSTLADCINQYASTFGTLPSSLAVLRQSSQYSYCATMQDPETNAPYEYRIVTPMQAQGTGKVGEFELCATFALATSQEKSRPAIDGAYGSYPLWSEHGVGRTCHTATAHLLTPVPLNQTP